MFKNMKKLLSLLLCLSLLLGAVAFAQEGEVTEAVAATAKELQDTDVLANVNGAPITWGEVKNTYDSLVAGYSSYYDMADPANVELFRAVALENVLSQTLLGQKAKEYGLDQLTAEEIATAEAQADSDWQNALTNYVSANYPNLTDESAQADKDAANNAAVQYYNDLGYSPESLREEYKKYAVFAKVEAMMTQDATVTDEEVEAQYQSLVAADKEAYGNDIAAYVEYNSYVEQMAMYAMYYGSANNMDYAWYRPAGFRAVKHILLPVDETLMATYKDLQARLEEQMNAEAAGEEAAATQEAAAEATEAVEPTATPVPVTQADVDNAKAEILASLADKIDEINQKIAEGADFDELIATYGVKADGTPSDAGMASEPYKTSGYEVASMSTNYVPEFVEAAFSVNAVGDVSAPFLSDYGVHIVKYIADVPEGPIAMTDAQREAKRTSLLESKKNELYAAKMEEWMTQSTIEYTGVTPSISEIEAREAAAEAAAAEAAQAEEAADPTESVEATTPEEAAQPEATVAP